MKKTRTILGTTLIMLLASGLFANNIVVENISMTGQDAGNNYTMIEFDIAWDNSWRTSSAPNNWDAAWIFAKYQDDGGAWSHCTLNTNDGNHTAPSGSTIEAVTDGKGVFIYRNANGTGSNNWDNARLRWEYGTDGVGDDATVTVKVFAIEMVYVPGGNFYLGDGSSTNRFHNGDNTGESFQVTSAQIELGQSDGKLWATGEWDNPSGSLQTDYPTGYDAFYMQKYEISQGQYVDFLNMLTYDQQDTRTATSPSATGQVNSNSYRNGLEVQTAGTDNTVPAVYGIDLNNNDGNLGEFIACNYLSWADGAAYADWAGLRPFTELEFEKACRGTQGTVSEEYAWGDATIHNSAYTITNDGTSAATVGNSTTAGNASYSTTDGSIDGPLRCGIFADSNSDRQESGASYYGIMEMSGNLWERPVTVGNATGRAFTGINGDGVLDATTGNANTTNWPGTGATGAGFRGGGWDGAASGLRVSARDGAANASSGRGTTYGGRGVRAVQAVPDAPIIGTATAGNAQASVPFTAPTNDGGSIITSYTATSNPGNITGTISQAGSGTITVSGLTNGTAYTFTVTATNSIGTSAASAASNSVTPTAPLSIGDYHQGGVIFYLDGSGGGLVCAVEDQNGGIQWYNGSNTTTGATATAIGTGQANTTTIINNQGAGSYAATVCDNYTGGGYTDWFLPSKDELNEMYENKANIDVTAGDNGGSSFASAYYWSSTESDYRFAWGQNFSNGYQGIDYKYSTTTRVRAVRAF